MVKQRKLFPDEEKKDKEREETQKALEEAEEKPLRILWAMIEQIRDTFMQPELIEGILNSNGIKKG